MKNIRENGGGNMAKEKKIISLGSFTVKFIIWYLVCELIVGLFGGAIYEAWVAPLFSGIFSIIVWLLFFALQIYLIIYFTISEVFVRNKLEQFDFDNANTRLNVLIFLIAVFQTVMGFVQSASRIGASGMVMLIILLAIKFVIVLSAIPFSHKLLIKKNS